MNISTHVFCENFPCSDVNQASYIIPNIEIDPEKIRIIMISEASPPNLDDYFYAAGNPAYLQTTLQAFHDAGQHVNSMGEIIQLGIYMTTALKCGKIGYSVSAKSIQNCSYLLEKEIALFANIQAFLLMGDVAIKIMNTITKRKTGQKVIPNGSTYKIRKNQFFYDGKRAFPSYLQTGKNYLIEKSKRKMIAEDIAAALSLLT